jgi:hypothetical protein
LNARVLFSNSNIERCYSLETLQTKIMSDNEKIWRLKSRTLRNAAIDENNFYFQNFANHQNTYNTIWDINDEQVSKVRGFA